MEGKLIVLGCGGSAGVPTIGNWWGNCDPLEPRNIRTRPSIALQTDTTLAIVDAGPDFREQMNREKLGVPDAIIITHEHSDHINGIDELRTLQRLTKGRKFPLIATDYTLGKLSERIGYMFKASEDGFYAAVCDAVAIQAGAPLTVGDITMQSFSQDHGSIVALGLRIGNVAYSTDVKTLGDPAFDILKGTEIWIVDAGGNQSRSNPVHACVDEIIEMNQTIGAKQVYLTHLPPTMDYRTLLRDLPVGYEPAYDGLTLEFKTS